MNIFEGILGLLSVIIAAAGLLWTIKNHKKQKHLKLLDINKQIWKLSNDFHRTTNELLDIIDEEDSKTAREEDYRDYCSGAKALISAMQIHVSTFYSSETMTTLFITAAEMGDARTIKLAHQQIMTLLYDAQTMLSTWPDCFELIDRWAQNIAKLNRQ